MSVSHLRPHVPRPDLARRALLSRALPGTFCLGTGLVVAAGLVIHAAGGELGTWLPPFVMRWEPRVDPLATVALLAVTGAAVCGPLLLGRLRAGVPFAAAVYGLALVTGLALNLARDGVHGWWGMFTIGRGGSFEGRFEYLPGLPLLAHGVGYFLRHFGSLLTYSTTHIKGNPPGPLIALHLLGIDTAPALAALCVGAGSLCAPLAYGVGRALGDEERGRLAGILTVLSPATLLFGVSSLDYAFAAVAMLTAWLLVHPGGRWWVAGALAAAVGTFLSWLLFAVPAWAVVVLWRRSGLGTALPVTLACGVAVAGLNLALHLATGYDPFSALRATHRFYDSGVANTRPYVFWLFGSPAAWIVMIGPPVAWLSLRALLNRDPGAVALWLLIGAASVLGLTKAETERIWLPFVPLACVTAAAALPAKRLRTVLLVLGAQAIVLELLFFTIW